jgi:hypothetical protein
MSAESEYSFKDKTLLVGPVYLKKKTGLILQDYANPEIEKIEIYTLGNIVPNDNNNQDGVPYISNINSMKVLCYTDNSNESNKYYILKLNCCSGEYNRNNPKFFSILFAKNKLFNENMFSINSKVIELEYDTIYTNNWFNLEYDIDIIHLEPNELATYIESNNNFLKSTKIKIKIFLTDKGVKKLQRFFVKYPLI